MFAIIAAIGKNRELGQDGRLLFRLKPDLQFFQATTSGHPVVMGRKTWDSLPHKLPDRQNIVVSRHPDQIVTKVPDQIISDLPSFIAASVDDSTEYFVIGGGELYQEFLPYAQILYLTEIDAAAPADTFFPVFAPIAYTKTLIQEGSEHGINFTISQYVKK